MTKNVNKTHKLMQRDKAQKAINKNVTLRYSINPKKKKAGKDAEKQNMKVQTENK